jgi:hypothetical protein
MVPAGCCEGYDSCVLGDCSRSGALWRQFGICHIAAFRRAARPGPSPPSAFSYADYVPENFTYLARLSAGG